MKKKLVGWICDLGIGFLDWGYKKFGAKDAEDLKWINESRAKFLALKKE